MRSMTIFLSVTKRVFAIIGILLCLNAICQMTFGEIGRRTFSNGFFPDTEAVIVSVLCIIYILFKLIGIRIHRLRPSAEIPDNKWSFKLILRRTGTILLIIICVFTLFMMTVMTMFSLFSMDPSLTHQPAIYSVFAALITGIACTIASIIYLIRHLLKII